MIIVFLFQLMQIVQLVWLKSPLLMNHISFCSIRTFNLYIKISFLVVCNLVCVFLFLHWIIITNDQSVTTFLRLHLSELKFNFLSIVKMPTTVLLTHFKFQFITFNLKFQPRFIWWYFFDHKFYADTHLYLDFHFAQPDL